MSRLRTRARWVAAAPDRAVFRIAQILRTRPALVATVTVLAAAGFLWLLLGPISVWATPVAGLTGKELADVRTATRQILLAAVGGLAILAGLAFTARTYYLTRRGQYTDRYTTATTQLASDRLTERLGGIYALEHLMVESDRDHDTVVEFLAAFIRQHPTAVQAEGEDDGEQEPPARHDVQAALTVLGRRPRRPERNPPDLSRSDLRGMRLDGLHLPGVDLWRSDLRRAVLMDATLTDANLCWARLEGAQLSWAHLQGAALVAARLEDCVCAAADFRGTDLRGTYLQRVRFDGANLAGANLEGAQLHGADLSRKIDDQSIQGLTVEQLASAELDDTTLLPGRLRAALAEHHRGRPDRVSTPEVE